MGLVENIFRSLSFGEWIRLSIVAGVCVAITWFESRLLGWPVFLRYEACLLASRSPAPGIAAAIVALAVGVPVGSLLLGRLRYDAGLFAAVVGLAALSA